MESEKAARRRAYMWAKLGRLLEQRAYERSESGNILDAQAAVKIAGIADACFWQSTGDADAFYFEETKL